MRKTSSRIGVLAIAVLLVGEPAWTQPAATPGAAAPAASAAAAPASQEDLDRLLAPIALYPDPLIAQILMACTYPLEVVLAARWSKENPSVTGKALEDAMQKQAWDPAVKALTAVPQVLKQMNENLAWMQKLGDAFLGDQDRVLETVQSLRVKAQAAGTLKSTPEQTVRTEAQESKTVIVIEPAQPGTMYVPTYNPYYAYGPWWYSYPPYYMYPSGYYYAPGLAFATGVLVGAAIWGGIGWGGGGVYINHNSYNNFNRTNIGNGNGNGRWNHNVDHRRGVAYGDNKVAQRYDRGGDARAVQSREQFRARADQGRAQLGSMDRSQLQSQVANRGGGQGARAGGSDFGGRGSSGNLGGRTGASVSTRPSTGASTRDYGSRSGSGFAGAGAGQSSRAASSRGSSSRSSMSGGSRGGGGRGGGRR
jgi:hypothetical protein